MCAYKSERESESERGWERERERDKGEVERVHNVPRDNES